MERLVLHVDVNNAFLSWSAVDMLNNGSKVDIRNRFAVIGGDEKERRGIVLAKSTSAKKKGIVTGESLYSARKKCPNLEVYPPNFSIYQKFSNMMYQYLCKYSPSIERYSIDECFIDYTGCEKLFGNVMDVAYKIKEDIKKNLGFTVNVGVGNNKLLAKMASDFTKPDMVHTLFVDEVGTKMWPLPVNELFMIGKKTSVKLTTMGIKTINDLSKLECKYLTKKFGKFGQMMYEYAHGIDNSPLELEWCQKSISNSTVLPYNYINEDKIKEVIRGLSLEVGKGLRYKKSYTDTLYVGIKYGDFSKINKQVKLKNKINSDNDLYQNFINIFDAIWNGEGVRNVCVGASNFSSNANVQLSLFDNAEQKEDDLKLQRTVDLLRDKYGDDKIIYGDMLKKNVKK